jgi:hypothetical protein
VPHSRQCRHPGRGRYSLSCVSFRPLRGAGRGRKGRTWTGPEALVPYPHPRRPASAAAARQAWLPRRSPTPVALDRGCRPREHSRDCGLWREIGEASRLPGRGATRVLVLRRRRPAVVPRVSSCVRHSVVQPLEEPAAIVGGDCVLRCLQSIDDAPRVEPESLAPGPIREVERARVRGVSPPGCSR